jgi:cytochrome c peroxidase
MAPRPHWFVLPLVVGAVGCSQSKSAGEPSAPPAVTPEQVPPADLAQLGRQIFFDTRLSEPPGQSCAVCHSAETG